MSDPSATGNIDTRRIVRLEDSTPVCPASYAKLQRILIDSPQGRILTMAFMAIALDEVEELPLSHQQYVRDAKPTLKEIGLVSPDGKVPPEVTDTFLEAAIPGDDRYYFILKPLALGESLTPAQT